MNWQTIVRHKLHKQHKNYREHLKKLKPIMKYKKLSTKDRSMRLKINRNK